ncbi:MAG: UDP-N-acetylmuramoyl-L-alanyl-D-glutamate--2,6-diaminopimelate ligase [Paracoccaceae bacterium]|jgi:UDP-N-acetylmuramoyl-L-alanyl-D-glutamate--2,6-diaminopimelate ligase|nr:UDP-N-acetylmuramoyl-L-alanyl-D-glutamate--2,6-diaminopimelate ligase [Paracoccaceae bacterium]MDP7185565.1 UDP-N-acetylmuramoyl-L-alanyl-D-glutamate--2,6-diaminopimelate ligase [Paracoccaceae bacterium]
MDWQPKSLSALGLTARNGRDVTITGIAVDSRDVRPGHLFAALPGVNAHGASFIATALKNGAAAVLTNMAGANIAADDLAETEAALVVVEDPRQALAYAAALWFGGQPDVMVAVTGTNGKTSVASFTRQIWEALGFDAVNVGTTGVEGAWEAPLMHTTPEPVTLHRALAGAASAGVTHGAMEASSHGLEQRRLDGVHLVAAGFTNLTQDHLDYHADFDAYFHAKAGLFDRVLTEDGIAVINIDSDAGVDMADVAMTSGKELLAVGRAREADLRILAQRFDATGQELRFAYDGKIHQMTLPLMGGFQVENAMMAAGLAIASGCAAEAVFRALPKLVPVRGRMQLAATRENGAAVFVDYAHTPDAVETALKALRPHVMGRLVVVLGAGGDRDATKRPLMGEAAAEHADLVFVTDDNPRSEDPAVIRTAVMLGAPDAIEVADRAEAILRAVDALGPGDALLIAGKGHETGQIIGDAVLPFDDVEQASMAVSALDGGLA